MIGVDAAVGEFVAGGGPVVDVEGVLLGDGFGEEPEGVDVVRGEDGGSDGEGFAEGGEVDADFVGEEGGEAVEGVAEVGFVGGAAVLAEEAFGEEEGDELAFRELEERELEGGRCVAVAVVLAAEIERGTELVSHELDVALDGAGVDFEFGRESFGVGKPAAAFKNITQAL